MSKKIIEKKVQKILDGGTKIVSFTYEGQKRNVLVGSALGAEAPVWGVQANRGLRKHDGKNYLQGLDNLDGRRFKVFAASKIRNLSV